MCAQIIYLNTHAHIHLFVKSLSFCLECKLMKTDSFVLFIAVSPAHKSIPATGINFSWELLESIFCTF